jgi:hypothetical protein
MPNLRQFLKQSVVIKEGAHLIWWRLSISTLNIWNKSPLSHPFSFPFLQTFNRITILGIKKELDFEGLTERGLDWYRHQKFLNTVGSSCCDGHLQSQITHSRVSYIYFKGIQGICISSWGYFPDPWCKIEKDSISKWDTPYILPVNFGTLLPTRDYLLKIINRGDD